jgi:hypothetical protein
LSQEAIPLFALTQPSQRIFKRILGFACIPQLFFLTNLGRKAFQPVTAIGMDGLLQLIQLQALCLMPAVPTNRPPKPPLSAWPALCLKVPLSSLASTFVFFQRVKIMRGNRALRVMACPSVVIACQWMGSGVSSSTTVLKVSVPSCR